MCPTFAEDIHRNTSDLSMAKRLRDNYSDLLKHHKNIGWLVWDGTRWKKDQKVAELYAHTIGENIRKEIDWFKKGRKDFNTIEKGLMGAATRAESQKGFENTLKAARTLPGINADDILFDDHPNLYNCLNGTVDLYNGDLLDHNPEKYLTQLCPTNYNPDAEFPMLEKHIRRIMGDDTALSECLKECLDSVK